jgi:hydrogenase maturation protease
MTARVIGLGHPDRGDDAIGLRVADRLGRQGERAVEVHRLEGSPLQLLTMWGPTDHVIVVDALRAPGRAGVIHRVDVTTDRLPRAAAGSGAHDASLADVIELARALDRLPVSLVVYGIIGRRFGIGDPPLPAVLDAVVPACERITAELRRVAAAPQP